jgi:hypothetical protein
LCSSKWEKTSTKFQRQTHLLCVGCFTQTTSPFCACTELVVIFFHLFFSYVRHFPQAAILVLIVVMLFGVLYLVSCFKEGLPILYFYLLICFASKCCIKTFNPILLFSYSYGPDFSFFTYKNCLSFAMSLKCLPWFSMPLFLLYTLIWAYNNFQNRDLSFIRHFQFP